METYELDPDKIISWAINYAGYEDLESAAKAIYAVYVERRKKEFPDKQRSAKQLKNNYRRRK